MTKCYFAILFIFLWLSGCVSMKAVTTKEDCRHLLQFDPAIFLPSISYYFTNRSMQLILKRQPEAIKYRSPGKTIGAINETVSKGHGEDSLAIYPFEKLLPVLEESSTMRNFALNLNLVKKYGDHIEWNLTLRLINWTGAAQCSRELLVKIKMCIDPHEKRIRYSDSYAQVFVYPSPADAPQVLFIDRPPAYSSERFPIQLAVAPTPHYLYEAFNIP